ncbi:MAG: amidophosphoribosyltransferase [Verrucomicrobia bacterium]|nr:amidophosphoribosyltransferase [Verrucomicrobiota bacterium]MCH8527888.1 amidophosphoribosyltransferase [Kiritimatiellia bacterium]
MCGIVGVVNRPEERAALNLYDALLMIQHRGQDAAGIATCDGSRLYLQKENGLVRDVFNDAEMLELKGSMGVAHCRYPTAGGASCTEAQPFYVNSPYGLVLAHNGNLTNTRQLTEELFTNDLRHLNTNSDSEVLLNVFAHELAERGRLRLVQEDVFDAVRAVHKRCHGAYAAIGMILGYGIVAFRDPNGIRPLVIGRRQDPGGFISHMVASESVALHANGYTLVRDVAPGECILIDMAGNLYSEQCAENPSLHPCVFEFVYLARPDSIIDGVSVYKARLRMGESLAEKIARVWADVDFDVVIPIPDTSRTSALPISFHLGVKYREGFIKNRYIGRTFIMPGQKERRSSIRKKLSPIPLEFDGKTVLLVDDSIVRGNTSQQIVQMAREAGAKAVYMASAAPPVRFPNVYGIDMPASYELIAHGRDESQIAKEIGADGVIYQDLDALESSVRAGNDAIGKCESSCFDGVYLTGDVTPQYLRDIEGQRNDTAKSQQQLPLPMPRRA